MGEGFLWGVHFLCSFLLVGEGRLRVVGMRLCFGEASTCKILFKRNKNETIFVSINFFPDRG